MNEIIEKDSIIYAVGIQNIESRTTRHIGRVVCRVESLGGVQNGLDRSENLSFVAIDLVEDISKCDITQLLKSLGDADLVFVVASPNESRELLLAQACGALFEKGTQAFLVLRDEAGSLKWDDTRQAPKVSVDGVIVLAASSQDVSTPSESFDYCDPSVQDHLIPPIIHSITDLITKRSVAMDLHDVMYMLSGKLMRCGSGIAAGDNRGVTAVEQAIDCIVGQRINLSEIDRILCNVSGSSSMHMNDLDSVSWHLETQFTNIKGTIVVGYIIDDHLGQNLKVSIVATLRDHDARLPSWINICDRVNRNISIPSGLEEYLEEQLTN